MADNIVVMENEILNMSDVIVQMGDGITSFIDEETSLLSSFCDTSVGVSDANTVNSVGIDGLPTMAARKVRM